MKKKLCIIITAGFLLVIALSVYFIWPGDSAEGELAVIEPPPVDIVEVQPATPSPMPFSFEELLAALPPYNRDGPKRLYEGSVTQFIPSEDYGRVYPYIGRKAPEPRQASHSEINANWRENLYTYGFVDQHGRIICDPVYRDVALKTFGDKAAFIAKKTINPGYVMRKEDNAWRSVLIENEEIHVVISLDGSYYAEYEDIYSSSKYITAKKNGLWGVVDYDGRIIEPFRHQNISGYHVRLQIETNDENGIRVVSDRSDGNYHAGIMGANRRYIINMRSLGTNGSVVRLGQYYLFHTYTPRNRTKETYQNKFEIFTVEGEELDIENDIWIDSFNNRTNRPGILAIESDNLYFSGKDGQLVIDEIINTSAAFQTDGTHVIGVIDEEQQRSDIPEFAHSFVRKYALIDKNNMVLDFKYDYLQWLGEYFCVVQGNYGGLLNPDGKWFVKIEFENAFD